MECAREAWVGGERQFVEGFFNNLFGFWNAEVAYIYAALRSSYRFHFLLLRMPHLFNLPARCRSFGFYGIVPVSGVAARRM
jgi:hypothetical protein